MDNLIHVLPETVSNQIAAGEVIQRPASVVKELMENAIDAGATQIDVVLKDAGRNMIMVLDNGKGMSSVDAHLAFERHSTSKLQQTSDLFKLRTMGFRGEALASIAAVAQVELVTRRAQDELAWKVEIEGSSISNEEPTLAAQGSRFTVRNLFYNIPARRKFLGDNTKELRCIKEEFIQIVLVYPDLQFNLTHNEEILYQLPPTTLRQRIISIFGKRSGGQLNKQLYPVEVNTPLVKIFGFIGDPAASCHRDLIQYFFVNNRFIRHKQFRSAVLKAYETLIPVGQQPTFFLYFEVDPEALDVNIHPTKTEVKFEFEQAIWPIVHAAVREALGKSNAIPSIDFDRDDAPEIRVFTGDSDVKAPSVHFDPAYNPFQSPPKHPVANWEKLFHGFEKENEKDFFPPVGANISDESQKLKEPPIQFSGKNININPENYSLVLMQGSPELFIDAYQNLYPNAAKFQLFGSFMVLHSAQSLIFVDQNRAHIRVLFERYMLQLETRDVPSQTLLFPEHLHLDPVQKMELTEIMDDLQALGFKVDCVDNEFSVMSVPADSQSINSSFLILDLMESTHDIGSDLVGDRRSRLALRLAKSAAIPNGQVLGVEEMNDLVEKLFASSEQKYTPDGKKIYFQISAEELIKRF